MLASLDEYIALKTFDSLILHIDEHYIKHVKDGLMLLGVVYATKIAFKLLLCSVSVVRTYVITRFWYDKDLSSKYGGKWAVITGASEGIGRSYARKLAQRKMNVLIISRNLEKLNRVASDIKREYNVETKCVAMDLSSLSDGIVYNELYNVVNSVDVGVLVNNVGALDEQDLYVNLSETALNRMVELNNKPMVLLTEMIVPQMVARNSGAIINISSFASTFPMPYMVVYSASKIFVDYFSKGLEYELSSHNVIVQTICPSLVTTQMTGNTKPDWFFVVDPETYVECAIRTLGVTHKTNAYWKHGLFCFIFSLMPEYIQMRQMFYTYPLSLKLITPNNVIGQKKNK